MEEGNLTMPTRNPHCPVMTTLADRNISLSNKKKWMLKSLLLAQSGPLLNLDLCQLNCFYHPQSDSISMGNYLW